MDERERKRQQGPWPRGLQTERTPAGPGREAEKLGDPWDINEGRPGAPVPDAAPRQERRPSAPNRKT